MTTTYSEKMSICCEAADSFLRVYFNKKIDANDGTYTEAAQIEFDSLYDELMGQISDQEIEDLSEFEAEIGEDFQEYCIENNGSVIPVPINTSIGIAWHEKDLAKIYLFKKVKYVN